MNKTVPSVPGKGGSWEHQCVLLAVTKSPSPSVLHVSSVHFPTIGRLCLVKKTNLAGYERPGVQLGWEVSEDNAAERKFGRLRCCLLGKYVIRWKVDGIGSVS